VTKHPGIAVLIGLAGAATAALAAEPAIPAEVQFNRDVRPIMVNTCFKCHGPDPKANKADLRLDLPDRAVAPRTDKTGRVYRAIVPGDPGASEVWRRVSSADPAQAMPPVDSLHLLEARDKEILRRWIAQGAVYQPHWAYASPRRGALPPEDPAARNEIDRFILKELHDRAIAPAPEADRATLLRRLSLDLTGLPPTLAETSAFLGDPAPDAYEKAVDRLLASPHYGERMAVAWLDLARFADTVGFHGDQRYNNFPYRDYVIDAFNRNEPFDQFTREQIAGDLLPHATDRDRTASGFNRLNMVTREGGAQPKEYLAKYAADRVRTVSTTWLGSTMGCCECHDHKYDPFKSKDFYAMAAFFSDVKQWGVYMDYTYTPNPELKGYNNDSPFPPEIEVDSPYLRQRAERIRARCAARVAEITREILATPALAGAAEAWAAEVRPRVAADPEGWAFPAITAAKTLRIGSTEVIDDHSVRITLPPHPDPARAGDGAAVEYVPPAGRMATVRLEVLPDPAFGGKVTNTDKDSFSVVLELWVQRAGAKGPERIHVQDAYADHPSVGYNNGHILNTVVEHWTSASRFAREAQSCLFVLDQPMTFAPGDRLRATVDSEDVGRFRLSVSPLGARAPGLPTHADGAAAIRAEHPGADERRRVAAEYFAGTGAGFGVPFVDTLADVRDIADCRGGRAFTIVTAATTPGVTRVLPRGNWQDESGPVVEPATPGFLTPHPPAAGGPRLTRLDLANWIVSRDNPLTARTFMNRLWKQCFGTGLSAVVDDLGLQGEFPSHPELLDWLAADFMDRGWDVKAMVRLIVTSATYRQSSAYRPELAEVDPNNRLLARQAPRRLEAEFVRDNALAAAGLISLDVGGPSVYPYQPAGYYAALQFPDRDYLPDGDERQYRRGVYMHWQRTFLHPMLANFDAPSREECTAARVVSSTPQQALTLLNDPTFVEAARGLAEQALSDHASDFNLALADAFRRLLARFPTEEEQASLRRFFDGQLAYYQGQPDEARKFVSIGFHPVPIPVDAVQLAAWTSVTRVLLNLNEAIVRY
jgi:hypothetical protein